MYLCQKSVGSQGMNGGARKFTRQMWGVGWGEGIPGGGRSKWARLVWSGNHIGLVMASEGWACKIGHFVMELTQRGGWPDRLTTLRGSRN